jgi:hypothetical protein
MSNRPFEKLQGDWIEASIVDGGQTSGNSISNSDSEASAEIIVG